MRRSIGALSGSLLLVLTACSGTEPSDGDLPGGDPPGTQIVFQSSNGSASDIYVANADGSGLTRLTDYTGADLAPSWSGDGQRIYFLSDNRDGGGTLDLYVMNADGTEEHLAAGGIYTGGSPWPRRAYAVSPDGTRIAVGAITAQGLSGNLDLFVMNMDGSGSTLIADLPCDVNYTHCEYVEALAWLLDGQRIAFAACWPGHGSSDCSIEIVNDDGTGQASLGSAGPNAAALLGRRTGSVLSSRPAEPSRLISSREIWRSSTPMGPVAWFCWMAMWTGRPTRHPPGHPTDNPLSLSVSFRSSTRSAGAE